GPYFTSFTPATPALADSWNNTLAYVRDSILVRGDVAAQPLIVGQAARLLAATALNTFPNTAWSEPTPADGNDATPDTMRKAAVFIEENAHTDISVADIAAAVHVSPRALRYAFRIHYGTSPLGHLRRARLDRAHFDLLAADPADGGSAGLVATIAARWGFPNPGNFAALYQDVYGVSPHNTLAA
ncbi:MAG: helix-turn-helix transcriptional regulator, partial [Streptomyces sp.]|uniref:helix-turn-helix transcriptional regulator n=1 Tax=Streptomyces sp. TaxID=1931 RepID=UPI003D6AF737